MQTLEWDSETKKMTDDIPPELTRLLHRWKPEDLISLLEKRCPECNSDSLIEVDGTVVCTRCGLEAESQLTRDNRLPFDTTYALTSDLAHGNSLGGTLPMKQLHKVIVKSKNGSYGLPIRAMHLKTLVQNVEPPQSLRLKEEISHIIKQVGLYSEEYNEFNHQLANQAGIIAQRVARFIQAGWTRPPSSYRRLAAALLVHILNGHPRMRTIIAEIKQSENPNIYDLGAINCLLTCPLLEPVKRSIAV